MAAGIDIGRATLDIVGRAASLENGGPSASPRGDDAICASERS